MAPIIRSAQICPTNLRSWNCHFSFFRLDLLIIFRKPFKKFIKKLRRKYFSLLEKKKHELNRVVLFQHRTPPKKESPLPKFILIDNAILDFSGHFYEYDQAVLSEISPDQYYRLAFTNTDFDRKMNLGFYIPYFRTHFYGICYHLSRPPKNHTKVPSSDFRYKNTDENEFLTPEENRMKILFKEDLISLFSEYNLKETDIVFFPNMNLHELSAVSELIFDTHFNQGPILKILLRRSIFEEERLSKRYQAIFTKMEKSFRIKSLEFFTDTDRLKEEYESISPFKFTVTPIPFRHHLICEKDHSLSTMKKKRITYLGGARIEKGFHLIPEGVHYLQHALTDEKAEFVLQVKNCSEPQAIESLRKLEAFQKGVTLLEQELSTSEYYELLSTSHILIISYDAEKYRSRSSCIFVESMVSGTPVIVTEKSWMASVIPSGVGELISNPGELGPALKKILDHYESYTIRSRQEASNWKKKHNPKEFCRILFGKNLLDS